MVHQALLGLQHIHEQGLVHRDLKTGNLMLVGGSPDSTRTATVKILDIGLGRALFDEGPGPGFDLTTDADLLGTPEYMAPEQARDPSGADVRADIYSLGCVLYHALAGQPPFVGASVGEVMAKVERGDFSPPRRVEPGVSAPLEAICLKAMRVRPAELWLPAPAGDAPRGS